MKQQRKIMSVGGSIIIPKTGFDIPFLKKFRTLILQQVKQGKTFILVIGGGGTCRKYQDAAKGVTKMTDNDLHWIGIHTTIFNAQFVRMLFKEHAYKDVITDPTKKIKTNKPIIIAAGWKPGCSTDTDAVLLAKTYNVKHILNLSNIKYAYDKDPNKFKNAKKIERMDWLTFRKQVVGMKAEFGPGGNAPFDPVASKMAHKQDIQVDILQGTNLKEVRNAINCKKFIGTTIHP